MNTYSKYTANVYLAKCEETHQKGDTITVTTKSGKENLSIVHNLIYEKDGFYFYSITRADGYNLQERAKNKSEKYDSWAESAERKSDEYYNKSNKDADFLSLGEPIKVGHHSERRHRKIVEQAQNNMLKSVEFDKKVDAHKEKAEYWASRANDINLSIPESVEFYKFKLEEAKALHEGLKSGKVERAHSFSLTYAKKNVNELSKKYLLAQKLWS